MERIEEQVPKTPAPEGMPKIFRNPSAPEVRSRKQPLTKEQLEIIKQGKEDPNWHREQE